MTRKVVFLDRDGVLNRAQIRNGKPYLPGDVFELEILPDVPAALAELRRAGFDLLAITNQSDVARGKTLRVTVEAINAELMARLDVDAILICFHDDEMLYRPSTIYDPFL